MACEKHRDSMTELALGEVHPKRELELLAHIGECDACREAYNGARKMRAGIERGVEALVAGEPSPHFVSRLRARIAAEPAPVHNAWLAWAPVGAAALAIVTVLIALLVRAPGRGGLDVAVKPPTPAASSDSSAGNLSPARAGISQPRSVHQPTRSLAARLRPAEPEVLIPKGQLAAVLEFNEAVSNGRIDGRELLVAKSEIDNPLEVKAIEVLPLERPAPLADPAEQSGGF